MDYRYLLFAVTTLLSSFLLFQVQPLLGKHILPWYGGSSSIWVAAMFFFMVVLALGYIYALLLSKLSYSKQILVHAAAILLVTAWMIYHHLLWPSAITPLYGEVTNSLTSPALAVFASLAIMIGLPFTILATTSSLLQLWYAKLSGQEPFSLYSISNIGSLLGLLSYPLLFEPHLSTFIQGQWWTRGFLLYTVLILLILYTLWLRVGKELVSARLELPSVVFKNSTFLVWMFIAALPVAILLSATSFMSSSVAPVPFLWVGPLALYLLSFIFSFRTGWRPAIWVNELLVMASGVLSLVLLVAFKTNIILIIFCMHLAVFAVSHWCHEYLYSIRPKAAQLTLFYVALSLGGIIGGLVITGLSLWVFTFPLELLLIFVSSTLFLAYSWFRAEPGYIPQVSNRITQIMAGLVIVLVLVSSYLYLKQVTNEVLVSERNFFGYKAVAEFKQGDEWVRGLRHGTTNHGFQIKAGEELVVLPTSYYGLSSGVGQVVTELRRSHPEGIKFLIAGLGSGGLLAYCQPEDEVIVVEIDNEVVELAQKYFTYIDSCPGVKIITRDARLLAEELAAVNKNEFNLIILDAYADDMMPVHIMTKEAVSTYKNILAEDGFLSVHISSRYLSLAPVLASVARENKLSAFERFDKEPVGRGAVPSQWVTMTRPTTNLTPAFQEKFNSLQNGPFGPLWSDTYSALLPVIRTGLGAEKK